MKEWIKGNKIYLCIGLFIIVALSYYYLFLPKSETDLLIEQDLMSEVTQSEELPMEFDTSKPIQKDLKADIKGAVKVPGVYEISEGERVIDLIEKAGGLTELAEESAVNLAMYVEDAMVIYIPKKGEQPVNVQSTPNSIGGETNAKININRADIEQLDKLPGIGKAKAETIIEYRETNGPFNSVEDLKSISGIGDKTFERLKDFITTN